MLTIGIPTGLQNAIFAIANLFVQVGVNSFDAVTVSGAAAAANADTLLFNMMAAFYTGCASFVSRNWGAGKTQRITKSYLVSMCYAAGVGAICGVLLLLFGRSFLSLFANETGVIDAGMERLRIMSFSYVVSPLMDASIAASRGIGKSVVPTVIVVMGSVCSGSSGCTPSSHGSAPSRPCICCISSPGPLPAQRSCCISAAATKRSFWRSRTGRHNFFPPRM